MDKPPPPPESPLERRLWVIGYIVLFVLIAAGAMRQMIKLLG